MVPWIMKRRMPLGRPNVPRRGCLPREIADDQRRPNFRTSPIAADTMLSAAPAHNDRSFHPPQGVINVSAAYAIPSHCSLSSADEKEQVNNNIEKIIGFFIMGNFILKMNTKRFLWILKSMEFDSI